MEEQGTPSLKDFEVNIEVEGMNEIIAEIFKSEGYKTDHIVKVESILSQARTTNFSFIGH